jgi:kumamolisin
VEPRPPFQDRIAEIVGDFRGTPDLSFDANPATGVWVLDTNLFQGQPGGWFIVGGTSVSAPSLAGIINAAGKFASSSQAENALIYRHLFGDRDDFRDIAYGTCGLNNGNFAVPGWDFCTGMGSDIGLGASKINFRLKRIFPRTQRSLAARQGFSFDFTLCAVFVGPEGKCGNELLPIR